MTKTRETLEVKTDFVTVDLLLWRRLGVEVPGLVEKTLALNPGLATLGPYLPVGTLVELELDTPTDTAPAQRVTRLWS